MEGWKDKRECLWNLVGKEVEVIFSDAGAGTGTGKREGVLRYCDDVFVTLYYTNNFVESIPIHRIIRVKSIHAIPKSKSESNHFNSFFHDTVSDIDSALDFGSNKKRRKFK